MPPINIDPRVRALAERIISEGKNKRAIAVLRVLLEAGTISTDDLNDLGYNHPPRAVGDVRDAGVPVITGSTTSTRSGRRMAVYSLGVADDIQQGRIGGRSAFPKSLKAALIEKYGTVDCITGAILDPKILQIDHRIPYRIAGDIGLENHDTDAFMLLDSSSQRAKSWACEHCPNMDSRAGDPKVCSKSFWAHPEGYSHIATEDIRRTDVIWQGNDVLVHDRLLEMANKMGISVSDLIKRQSRRNVGTR